jgi:hypothetical protein
MTVSHKDEFSTCVLVFMKAPRKGEVKTRLARSLNEDVVIPLYKAFIADTLSMLEESGHPIIVCVYPGNAVSEISTWLGCRHPVWPQEGRDIGEKMALALARAFAKGYTSALLMGTDIPDLPKTIISEGFNALHTHDAVIGPSDDGGYYLIGFNQNTFLLSAFEGISWSTEKVFEQTIRILKTGDRTLYELPRWQDVDQGEDLTALAHRLGRSGEAAPQTFRCLSSLGLIHWAG